MRWRHVGSVFGKSLIEQKRLVEVWI